jgi:hypothetical protein
MARTYKKRTKSGKKIKGGKCGCNSFFGGKKSRQRKRQTYKRRRRVMKGGNSVFNNPIGGNVTTSGAIADANIMGGNMDSRTGLYNAGDSNDFVV